MYEFVVMQYFRVLRILRAEDYTLEKSESFNDSPVRCYSELGLEVAFV